jgi:hypothetical protein
VLLAAAVVAACGRGRPAEAVPAQPAPAAVESTAAPDSQPTAEVTTTDTTGEPTAEATATAGATYAVPDPARDPVTIDLRSIDQLINDVNGSLSGATAGGE